MKSIFVLIVLGWVLVVPPAFADDPQPGDPGFVNGRLSVPTSPPIGEPPVSQGQVGLNARIEINQHQTIRHSYDRSEIARLDGRIDAVKTDVNGLHTEIQSDRTARAAALSKEQEEAARQRREAEAEARAAAKAAAERDKHDEAEAKQDRRNAMMVLMIGLPIALAIGCLTFVGIPQKSQKKKNP